jgi:hypothetical protein
MPLPGLAQHTFQKFGAALLTAGATLKGKGLEKEVLCAINLTASSTGGSMMEGLWVLVSIQASTATS